MLYFLMQKHKRPSTIRLLLIFHFAAGLSGYAQGKIISQHTQSLAVKKAWPSFRHDAQGSGRSGFSGPDSAYLRWTYNTSVVSTAQQTASPIIAADGSIYITGRDSIYAITIDGKRKWHQSHGATSNWGVSLPALSQDEQKVYYAIMYSESYKPPIADLISRNTSTGEELWRLHMMNPAPGFINAPVVDESDIVYYPCNDTLYSVNSSGTVLWRAPTLNHAVFSTEPAVSKTGYVSVGCANGALYAFNTSDGSLYFTQQATGNIIASPTIDSQGTIYFGTQDTLFAVLAHLPQATVKWKHPFGIYNLLSSSTVLSPGDSSLFFATSYALGSVYSASGLARHGLDPDDGLMIAAPAIDVNGNLYYSYSGAMYGLTKTLEPRWYHRPAGSYSGSQTSSPALGADSSVCFVDDNGLVYSFGKWRICGYVCNSSGQPLPGVSITGLPTPVVTDSQGYFCAYVRPGWRGQISPRYGSYTFAPPSQFFWSVVKHQSLVFVGAPPPDPIISGKVTLPDSITPLAGVIVRFAGIYVDTTDASGFYRLQPLYGSSGAVGPSKSGYHFNPTLRFYMNLTSNKTVHFIAYANPYVQGKVEWSGTHGAGIPDVQLQFKKDAGADTTDDSGSYNHQVPFQWRGWIVPSKAGVTFTPDSVYCTAVSQDTFIAPITGSWKQFDVSGRIVDQLGKAIPLVLVTFKSGDVNVSVVSNPDGTFKRSVNYDWSGSITLKKTDYDFIPNSINITPVRQNTNLGDIEGGRNPIIRGNIHSEDNLSRLASVVVYFLEDKRIVGRTVSDRTGTFSDTVSYGWSGTVRPEFTPYTFKPPERTYTTLKTSMLAEDYTFIPPDDRVVSGRVTLRDANGAGVDSVRLTFSDGGTVFTHGGGIYSKGVKYGWSGTIVPWFDAYTFDPDTIPLTNVTSNTTDQNFFAFPPPNPIVDGYVLTLDRIPVAGVVLHFDGLSNDTTDSQGYYQKEIPYGWTGRMIPEKADFAFYPVRWEFYQLIANRSKDFIAYPYPIISGRIVESPTEMHPQQPVAGVVLNFSNNAGTAATADDGTYSLIVPYNWSGDAMPVKDGWNFTPDKLEYQAVQQNRSAQDYIGFRNKILISGQAYTDADAPGGSQGIQDVLLQGLPDRVITHDSGHYVAEVIYGWTGTVTPVKDSSHYGFMPKSRAYNTPLTANLAGQNYEGGLNPYISGRIMLQGTSTGLPGVELTFSKVGTARTDANGLFTQTVPYGWSGRVVPYKRGFVFTVDSLSFQTSVKKDITQQDFYAVPPNPIISGRATRLNGSGIQNAVVSFSSAPDTARTGADGSYAKMVPYGWSGQVLISKENYGFIPDSIELSGVIANMPAVNFEGGLNPLVSGSILHKTTGKPIGNVICVFTKAGSVLSDSLSGFYLKRIPYGWSGTVTPAFNSYSFDPPSRSYEALKSEKINQDYQGLPPPNPVISGRIVLNINNQVGLDSVLVVFSDGASTLTFGGGYFSKQIPWDWSGTIKPVKPFYTFSPESLLFNNVNNNQDNEIFIATAMPMPLISGRIELQDRLGLDGVIIRFSNRGGDTLSDQSGVFQKRVPHGWSGTITPEKESYHFFPLSIDRENVIHDQPELTFNAAANPFISGQILTDSTLGSTAVDQVILTFSNGGGRAVSDRDGRYSLQVPYEWSGDISPFKQGMIFSPHLRSLVRVISDRHQMDYLASWKKILLSGYIRTNSGHGVAGVQLSGFPQKILTDSSGYFQAWVNYGWSNRIVLQKEGFTLIPGDYFYPSVLEDAPLVNFTAWPDHVISGRVALANGSGVDSVAIHANDGSTVWTDRDGNYRKQVKHDWSGAVMPAKSGYFFDPLQFTFEQVTTDLIDRNFIAKRASLKISGRVIEINNGHAMAGVQITWSDSLSTTTDADGQYAIEVNYNWSGVVTPSLASFGFIPEFRSYTKVQEDQPIQDFTAFKKQLTISGRILTAKGMPISGVLVNFSNGLGDAITDELGYYEKQVPYRWSGAWTPRKSGYHFNPYNRGLENVVNDQKDADFDAAQNPFVSGRIFFESADGGAAVSGVVLSFSNEGGIDTTSAEGAYQHQLAYQWSGIVTPSKEGIEFSPAAKSYPPVSYDQTDQNFRARWLKFTISGYILTSDNVALTGVCLYNDKGLPLDTTDAQGFYRYSVNYATDVVCRPVKAGYAFVPPQLDHRAVTKNLEKQNHTAFAKPQARFSLVLWHGCRPFDCRPVNLTSGHVDRWLWKFGDGNTSSLKEPTHRYANVGSYTVSLQAISDVSGSSIFSFPSSIIVFDVQCPDTVNMFADIKVNWPLSVSPGEAQVIYRWSGQQNWANREPFQFSSGVLTARLAVPASLLRGLDYYLSFKDSVEFSYPEQNPHDNPEHLVVRIDSSRSPVQLQPMRYKMVSIPYRLDQDKIENVLADDLGRFGLLPQQWRLFRWVNGAYSEYPQLEQSFTPGQAFWLAARYGGSFDGQGGYSVSAMLPCNIILQPGWNQIANPFAFPVEWDKILVQSGLSASVVQMPVYYDTLDYRFNCSTLDPWEGYWVKNKTTAYFTLRVPPIEATPSLMKQNLVSVRHASDFIVQLSLHQPGVFRHDEFNYIGFLQGANLHADSLDLYQPPSVEESCDLRIIREGEALAGDFRPMSADGEMWLLELLLPQSGGHAVMDLIPFGELSENFIIRLLDVDQGCCLAVENHQLDVPVLTHCPIRHFKFIMGTLEFCRQMSDGIPLEVISFGMEQNYPNPFNLETTIAYHIARTSEVELQLFDRTGRKVRTLISATKKAGHYWAHWNGRDEHGQTTSSGLYFCRLKTNDFCQVKKIIFVK